MSAEYCMIHISQKLSFNNSPAPEESILDHETLRKEDYETMEELGSGGSSSVLRAKSKVDGSLHAIKVIPRVDNGWYWQDDMITNEINILQGLNHPSIMGFSGFYCVDYNCHLVCEYAAGGDLKNKTHISDRPSRVRIRNLP
ncbi:uncharacterized protein MELLADRAFT_102486 [Melampsora larici-populina 98AG31]|uniref:Protein kinase domain-containing protein n=1 Tax=Melampsora larici-populina (strain 98AG31 / pathotype 3-4-7) TaxID=747676 RepID=F4R8H0_MELLP|nr:uncharacterized protein MELLADRAFT_102486 [Melampsora larici-populina 98AG31]EGG11483.1 hypothetical protein MELLADRAFT_102486 [Melampsora larici-populina 98AG31]